MAVFVVCNKYDMVTSEYHCYCECKECYNQKEPELDDWIKPFFENCCRMEKVNVGKR